MRVSLSDRAVYARGESKVVRIDDEPTQAESVAARVSRTLQSVEAFMPQFVRTRLTVFSIVTYTR